MATEVASRQKVGKVVQVIGPVVDIEFADGHLPDIYNAVHIVSDGTGGSAKVDIICEVEQHLGEARVRTVSMKPTDGMQRGMTAVDLGEPISMPVGPATLGRAVGDVLDRATRGRRQGERDARDRGGSGRRHLTVGVGDAVDGHRGDRDGHRRRTAEERGRGVDPRDVDEHPRPKPEPNRTESRTWQTETASPSSATSHATQS